MADTTIEFSGRIDVDAALYGQELINEDVLTDPRLIEIRELIGGYDTAAGRDTLPPAAEVILVEVLRSHELDIGRRIRIELNNLQGPRELVRTEPAFSVQVRFGNGSILYSVFVTIAEFAGTGMAKTALTSLVIAAVEPRMLGAVRNICHAASSFTSRVHEVATRSAIEPLAGPAAAWLNEKTHEAEAQIKRYTARRAKSRTRRIWISIAVLVVGTTLANAVVLMAIARKLGSW